MGSILIYMQGRMKYVLRNDFLILVCGKTCGRGLKFERRESKLQTKTLKSKQELTFIHELLIKVEGVLPFLDVMLGCKILRLNPLREPAIFWARFWKHSGWWWSNAVLGPNSCLNGALSL